MNAKLADSAKRIGYIYVDNDSNFKLRNGQSDTNTLDHRGLHLSRSGTSRLLQNMNISHSIIASKKDKSSSSSPAPSRKHRPTNHGTTQRGYNRGHYHRQDSDNKRDASYRMSRRQTRTQQQQHEQQHYRGEYDGCHFCGGLSHTRRNCRYGEPVECYKCGDLGHLSYFCNHHDHGNADVWY